MIIKTLRRPLSVKKLQDKLDDKGNLTISIKKPLAEFPLKPRALEQFIIAAIIDLPAFKKSQIKVVVKKFSFAVKNITEAKPLFTISALVKLTLPKSKSPKVTKPSKKTPKKTAKKVKQVVKVKPVKKLKKAKISKPTKKSKVTKTKRTKKTKVVLPKVTRKPRKAKVEAPEPVVPAPVAVLPPPEVPVIETVTPEVVTEVVA